LVTWWGRKKAYPKPFPGVRVPPFLRNNLLPKSLHNLQSHFLAVIISTINLKAWFIIGKNFKRLGIGWDGEDYKTFGKIPGLEGVGQGGKFDKRR